MTKFKLRARKYSQKIWGGQILVPKAKANETIIARGIAGMDTCTPIPKVSMFLYTVTGMLASVLGGRGGDLHVIHVVDGNGEQHGRKLLAWALEIPGVVDNTTVMNMRGLSKLQAAAESTMGNSKAWVQAITLPRITEEIVLDTFKWHSGVRSLGGSIAQESYFIFELFSMVSTSLGRLPDGATDDTFCSETLLPPSRNPHGRAPKVHATSCSRVLAVRPTLQSAKSISASNSRKLL